MNDKQREDIQKAWYWSVFAKILTYPVPCHMFLNVLMNA